MARFRESAAATFRQAAERRQARRAALLLAPSVVLLLTFTYWPIAEVVIRSARVSQFGGGGGWGGGNYARLAVDPHFLQAFWNNTLYALGTVIPSLLLAFMLALGLRRSTWLTAILRSAIVAPMMIPLVAAAALASFVLLPGQGLLDHALAHLGIGAHDWLGSPALALPSIVAISVWKDTGTYMLFFLAGLAAVPDELLDAARLDGASALSRLLHVVLPLLTPTIAFLVPIALLNALIQVDQVVLLTQGGPSGATTLILYYIYQQAAQNDDAGLASAATVVAVGTLLLLSWLALRALDRRAHYAS